MSVKMFVDGWKFGGVLGEGAFGEVKLLINLNTNSKVAVKMVDLKKHKDAEMMVKKEICIQKALNHENVLKFYGSRQEESILMMFLEYAIGGELFDKIEPDVGMPSGQAQYYIKQLLNGVHYLHQKGIAHRDIKPENLLIDENNILKICDFGLATMFRLRGKERMLDKRCGTMPYVAPEVIVGVPYRAEPADIWSCGVVFICMLCGEAPFNQASQQCSFYERWITGNYILTSPWTKLPCSALNLVKKILVPDPKQRMTIPQILDHSWMNTSFKDYGILCLILLFYHSFQNQTSKMLMFILWKFSVMVFLYTIKLDYQSTNVSKFIDFGPNPLVPSVKMEDIVGLLKTKNNSNVCFSQPTQNEDLMVNSQMPLTQTQSIDTNTFHCMVKRMTRFFVEKDVENVLQILGAILDKLHYTWNFDVSGVITVSTIDQRKSPLVFKINLLEMDSKLLLDFRLSKGCGLEFKRKFIKLKQVLRNNF